MNEVGSRIIKDEICRETVARDSEEGKNTPLRYLQTTLGICVYGYMLGVLVVWALLWLAGDRWWFATLLLMGPRWVYAVPLVVLIPLAVLWRRRWLFPVGLSAIIVFWPIMGLQLPAGASAPNAGHRLRVLSYNIQRYAVSEEDFAELLADLNPDLVAVQECAGPGPWRLPEGWNVQQPRRSELLIASRYPMSEVEISRCQWPPESQFINGLYCVVETPAGPIGFCNLHLETPKPALQLILDPKKVIDFSEVENAKRQLENRRRETEDLADWLNGFAGEKVVAGDFNMPSESGLYRDNWSEYRNAFCRAGFGYGHTKHTKVDLFRFGSRIDHVIVSPSVEVIRCWVGPDLGSDHLPLIADISVE